MTNPTTRRCNNPTHQHLEQRLAVALTERDHANQRADHAETELARLQRQRLGTPLHTGPNQ